MNISKKAATLVPNIEKSECFRQGWIQDSSEATLTAFSSSSAHKLWLCFLLRVDLNLRQAFLYGVKGTSACPASTLVLSQQVFSWGPYTDLLAAIRPAVSVTSVLCATYYIWWGGYLGQHFPWNHRKPSLHLCPKSPSSNGKQTEMTMKVTAAALWSLLCGSRCQSCFLAQARMGTVLGESQGNNCPLTACASAEGAVQTEAVEAKIALNSLWAQ